MRCTTEWALGPWTYHQGDAIRLLSVDFSSGTALLDTPYITVFLDDLFAHARAI